MRSHTYYNTTNSAQRQVMEPLLFAYSQMRAQSACGKSSYVSPSEVYIRLRRGSPNDTTATTTTTTTTTASSSSSSSSSTTTTTTTTTSGSDGGARKTERRSESPTRGGNMYTYIYIYIYICIHIYIYIYMCHDPYFLGFRANNRFWV